MKVPQNSSSPRSFLAKRWKYFAYFMNLFLMVKTGDPTSWLHRVCFFFERFVGTVATPVKAVYSRLVLQGESRAFRHIKC